MSLTAYDPMRLIHRMQSELNDFFHTNGETRQRLLFDDESWISREWAPRVDFREEQDRFVVTADIPGVDPKDIEVSMSHGILSLKGERKTEKEEKKKGYHLKECSFGTFQRAFRLPDTADGDAIKAKGKNGVLTISIGKKAGAESRRIEIES